MIDERRLDEMLKEAGEELCRLSGDHHVAPGESGAARRGHGRWFPILAAAAAVAIGVTGLILVRNDRASSPGDVADVSVSATTAPPAPATSAALDASTLPYLMLANPPDGYLATRSFSGGFGKDFEPPAYLFGWRMADGEEVYVPVVLSWQSWPAASLPGARDVDTEAVSGWIATVDGATVGAFDVDGMPVHVRAASTAVPDEDLIALAANAPAATELEFVHPASFVELARQTADAVGNFTAYTTPDGGELSFGTLGAMPLNGLTIGSDATATPVTVRDAPAIVISGGTADGAAAHSLFWSGADNVVRFLATADQGTTLTVDDLIALAENTRAATPFEIGQFEEI